MENDVLSYEEGGAEGILMRVSADGIPDNFPDLFVSICPSKCIVPKVEGGGIKVFEYQGIERKVKERRI